MLHGWDEPLCPQDATITLAAELTEAKADWQLHAYGKGHAFTSPEASGPGLLISPTLIGDPGRRFAISFMSCGAKRRYPEPVAVCSQTTQ